MNMAFDFSDLFILEVANNHQGDENHGLSLLKAHGEVARKKGIRAAFKFQMRDLPTFIHPAHQEKSEVRHVHRFQSTALPLGALHRWVKELRTDGFIPMVTPFDERSVGHAEDIGFDVLKIGSCSARDWPLLEAVAQTGKPVVCSTGGLEISAIDDLVSFFQHRGSDFALMHCVSLYPTPPEHLELIQIQRMKKRYPEVPIGFSTHEAPDNTRAVQMAYAFGARIFERHIGLPSERVSLNAYSSTPQQMATWFDAWQEARLMAGHPGEKGITEKEGEALRILERGVFVKEDTPANTPLGASQVFFAFPRVPGQMHSGEFVEGVICEKALMAQSAVMLEAVQTPPLTDAQRLKDAIHEVKALLNEAGVVLDTSFRVEFSHHHGVPAFRQIGAVLISCFNREYCKKIVVQLPGQEHPRHFHKTKEETFQVLSGTLQVELDNQVRTLTPGQTLLIQPGVFHRFWTQTGTIFEEISTHDAPGDSHYQDPRINEMAVSARKTEVENWGRFALQEKLP
jgi:N-acetylneuraminate synthase